MRISESCYALTGLCNVPPWTTNAGLIVGNHKTLIVDTGINLLSAQTIFGYALAVKAANKLLVVNTERHFDHMGGNSFFYDRNIEIYGHFTINRTSQVLTDTSEDYNECITNHHRRQAYEANTFFAETRVVNPTQKVSEERVFDLGGLEVQLLLTPGHTPTNLSLFVANEKVLFCSDCLVNGYIPNLENGTPEDWQTWLDSLEVLEKLEPAIVVPGHGQILRGAEIQSEFERHKQILEKAIASGRAPTAYTKTE